MDIDLTPLVQALAALALAAIAAATPYLAPLLGRYLHIRLTATQAAAIQRRPTSARRPPTATSPQTPPAIATCPSATPRSPRASSMSIASVPEALAALGVTPEHVRDMVEARFGGLLAADPTVSIGEPATA